MTSYIVKSRSTTAWKEQTVDAESRDQAIYQVVEAAAEGDEVEVCSAIEAEPDDSTAATKKATHAAVAQTGAKREAHHKG